jgi:hypothetical protein
MLDQEFDISRVVLLQARAAVTFISVCQHTNAGEALIHTHTHTHSLSLSLSYAGPFLNDHHRKSVDSAL